MGNSTSSNSTSSTSSRSVYNALQKVLKQGKKSQERRTRHCCCESDDDLPWMHTLSELAKMPNSADTIAKIIENHEGRRLAPHRSSSCNSCSRIGSSNGISSSSSTSRRELTDWLEVNRGVGIADNLDVSATLLSAPPPPASKKQIQSLPKTEGINKTKHYCNSNNDDDDDDNTDPCHICYDHFTEDSIVKHLPCGHLFHARCIDAWLNRHCTCPVCREELPTDDLLFEYLRTRQRTTKPTTTTTITTAPFTVLNDTNNHKCREHYQHQDDSMTFDEVLEHGWLSDGSSRVKPEFESHQ